MEDKENAIHLGIIAYILNDLETPILDEGTEKAVFQQEVSMIKMLTKDCISILSRHGISIQDAKITIESTNYLKTIQVKANDFLVQSTEG